MCNVMPRLAYPLCRRSLEGKDMARPNEFGGDDTAQKVKSGKICALGRMINGVRDLNMEIQILMAICSYGVEPEDKQIQMRCLTVPINRASPFTPLTVIVISLFHASKYSLGFISIISYKMGPSSISISELFPRQLLMILNLIISKYSVGVTIIPYLHKIFIVSFMDFWTGNCKANITSVTSENILSAILIAQWPITN